MTEAKYPYSLTECAVFYDPDGGDVIDGIHPHTGLGVYGEKSLEETREKYPHAVILSLEAATLRVESKYRSSVVEITEEQFDDYFGQLPPKDYRHECGAVTFKSPEHTCGDITAIYCNMRGRYFTLADVHDMPHEEIVKRCEAFMADQPTDE